MNYAWEIKYVFAQNKQFFERLFESKFYFQLIILWSFTRESLVCLWIVRRMWNIVQRDLFELRKCKTITWIRHNVRKKNWLRCSIGSSLCQQVRATFRFRICFIWKVTFIKREDKNEKEEIGVLTNSKNAVAMHGVWHSMNVPNRNAQHFNLSKLKSNAMKNKEEKFIHSLARSMCTCYVQSEACFRVRNYVGCNFCGERNPHQ